LLTEADQVSYSSAISTCGKAFLGWQRDAEWRGVMTVMAGDVRINLLPAANYDNFGEDSSNVLVAGRSFPKHQAM
jgi:Na+-transporting NADH:ubiquinone oxidoreductase subunit NqrB